jgi:hypothetical protein
MHRFKDLIADQGRTPCGSLAKNNGGGAGGRCYEEYPLNGSLKCCIPSNNIPVILTMLTFA